MLSCVHVRVLSFCFGVSLELFSISSVAVGQRVSLSPRAGLFFNLFCCFVSLCVPVSSLKSLPRWFRDTGTLRTPGPRAQVAE